MQALVTAAGTGDYRLMAKALIQMGATAPVEEARAPAERLHHLPFAASA